MNDDNGVVQLWLISPNGGELRQLTASQWGIQSAFSWSPQGEHLAFICDNSVMLCDSLTGHLRRLTARSVVAPLADAVVFSPNGKKIALCVRSMDGHKFLLCMLISIDKIYWLDRIGRIYCFGVSPV
ncbi:hypothetical protein A8M56_17785 [Yersinia pestis]|nr:hypothetical protein A8M56_17785 [Yersinia pestis]